MGENTKIQWATHTFNPWRGCAKIAPGCANCYADAQSRRNPKTLGIWGSNGTRVVASEAMWREPLKWNREAEQHREAWAEDREERESLTFPGRPHRPRVLCASFADVFEDWRQEIRTTSGMVLHQCDKGHFLGLESVFANGIDCIHGCDRIARPTTLDDVRARLFRTWRATPNLWWLALAKRIENARRMLDVRHENLWLGTSIACQEDADRNAIHLRDCRYLCAKTFLSIEPIVGPVDLRRVYVGDRSQMNVDVLSWVDWVIVGGESGANARPCDIEWIRSIVRQCQGAGVPVFVKQWGSQPVEPDGKGFVRHAMLRDPKGGDPSEWPEDVRVREVPV